MSALAAYVLAVIAFLIGFLFCALLSWDDKE